MSSQSAFCRFHGHYSSPRPSLVWLNFPGKFFTSNSDVDSYVAFPSSADASCASGIDFSSFLGPNPSSINSCWEQLPLLLSLFLLLPLLLFLLLLLLLLLLFLLQLCSLQGRLVLQGVVSVIRTRIWLLWRSVFWVIARLEKQVLWWVHVD